jgi:hypothetical protein
VYPVLLTSEQLYGVDVWMAAGSHFKYIGRIVFRRKDGSFSPPLPIFPSRRHGRIAG